MCVNLGDNTFISPAEEVEGILLETRKILSLNKKDVIDFYCNKNNEDTMLLLDYDTSDVYNELNALTVKDYLHTMIDDKKSEVTPFYVFGKTIQNKDIYMKFKIRKPKQQVFIVSFHIAEWPINKKPYNC